MEIKKFNNFILENKEVSEKPKKSRCEDCGKKIKKCKCPVTEKIISEQLLEKKKKMSKAEFLEMIHGGKKGKKEKKEDKSCKKCEK